MKICIDAGHGGKDSGAVNCSVKEKDINLEIALKVGSAKANRPLGRLFVLSILAGAFIALGGVLSLILGSGFAGATSVNPSLGRLLSGLAFPVGLFMIVMTGADLFTGNNALLMPGALRGDTSLGRVAANWLMVWVGNFIVCQIIVRNPQCHRQLTHSGRSRSCIGGFVGSNSTLRYTDFVSELLLGQIAEFP